MIITTTKTNEFHFHGPGGHWVMNSLSFDSNAFLSPPLASRRNFSARQPAVRFPNPAPQRVDNNTTNRFVLPEDRISHGLSLGLIAFTLPTVGYAFYQLWHLVGGETLTHAVQAFAR